MNTSFSSAKVVNLKFDQYADGNASKASASDPPQRLVPSDAAIEHFDVLLGAVATRLGLAVGDARTEAMAITPEVALQRLRTTVLECAEALEQLQATQRYLRG